MPSKGKTRISERQRRQIAAGKAAGKHTGEIAADTGLAESTVRKHVADERTLILIRRLKAKHEAKIEQLFEKSLKVVERALNSKDDDVALRAVDRVIRIAEAGDPPLARVEVEARDTSKGTFTLAELLETLRRAEQ